MGRTIVMKLVLLLLLAVAAMFGMWNRTDRSLMSTTTSRHLGTFGYLCWDYYYKYHEYSYYDCRRN